MDATTKMKVRGVWAKRYEDIPRGSQVEVVATVEVEDSPDCTSTSAHVTTVDKSKLPEHRQYLDGTCSSVVDELPHKTGEWGVLCPEAEDMRAFYIRPADVARVIRWAEDHGW